MSIYPDALDDISDLMIDDSRDDDIQEGIGYKYNYIKGETIVQTGRTVHTNEHHAYLWWVYKCLHTERYQYPYYSTDFGVELEEILAADYPRNIAESEMIRSIKEALAVDERTVKADNFVFSWGRDTLQVDFELENIYNTDIISLKRGDD